MKELQSNLNQTEIDVVKYNCQCKWINTFVVNIQK